MKWFQGSITEAVTTSKSRKAIFVVYIEGKDEASAQMSQILDNEEISKQLEQEHFVALKLESGSQSYTFFTQIYHLVPVPSIFFIGENGMPLEIVAGDITIEILSSKIQMVLSKSGKMVQGSSISLIQAEQKSSNSANTNVPLSETKPISTSSVNTTLPVNDMLHAVNNVEACSLPETNEQMVLSSELQEEVSAMTSTDEKAAHELTTEEKVERAKRLIELQKKQRIEEERRNEKERELERRKIGKDVQKMRRKIQDLEIQQAHEERLKEKAAEAAAREKVRQQIAQDKLERKQKELALQQQLTQQKEVPKAQNLISEEYSSTARIQFRLPSGTTHTAQFEPTTSLASLRTYVVQNIELPFQRFTMYTSYPRKDLTLEDAAKTLIDLELVPTSVILIIPQKNNTATSAITNAQGSNFFTHIFWMLFSSVMNTYNYVTGLIFGVPRRRDEATNDSNEHSQSFNDNVPSYVQNLNQRAELRRDVQGSRTIRTQGNIHRLHSDRDDNDENNTWNGNSTQQM